MNKHIRDAAPNEWLGSRFDPMLTAEQTGGSMCITDTVCPPGFSPPRHIHHDADEIFVVLTGDMKFWLDGKTVTVGPGGAIFIPRGSEHSFCVVSDIPARHLTIFAPGNFEGFFAEMCKGNFQIPADMEKIIEIGNSYHVEFTGPPLAAED